jgi:hypothetical protein
MEVSVFVLKNNNHKHNFWPNHSCSKQHEPIRNIQHNRTEVRYLVLGQLIKQWRTEGGGVGWRAQTPTLPKFRSFSKAEPNSQFRGKYIRNCLVFLFHHSN